MSRAPQPPYQDAVPVYKGRRGRGAIEGLFMIFDGSYPY